MAKRVIWTNTAKAARREILEYWTKHNKSNLYSKKLSALFKEKIALIRSENYLGKPTDYADVRASFVSHFTIFFRITSNEIIIVGVWDNRRNPDDLIHNLGLI